MLFVTIHFPLSRWKRRIIPAVLAVIALIALCCLIRAARHTAEETFDPQDQAEQACLECLRGFGWEADDTPVSAEACVLSEQLSRDYLDLQLQAGFDLSPHLGSTVTRYTFRVTNYPTGEADIYADLLVLEGTVIGGDIRSADLSGFMHSLRFPE